MSINTNASSLQCIKEISHDTMLFYKQELNKAQFIFPFIDNVIYNHLILKMDIENINSNVLNIFTSSNYSEAFNGSVIQDSLNYLNDERYSFPNVYNATNDIFDLVYGSANMMKNIISKDNGNIFRYNFNNESYVIDTITLTKPFEDFLSDLGFYNQAIEVNTVFILDKMNEYIPIILSDHDNLLITQANFINELNYIHDQVSCYKVQWTSIFDIEINNYLKIL